MLASVVIACRNAEPFLTETLEALAAQDLPQPWELIFADNGSTDTSARTFTDFAARNPGLPTCYVDASQRPGKAAALNHAIPLAASTKIVVVDADDVPEPDFLRLLVEALDHHDFVAGRLDVDRLNTGPTGVYRRPDQDSLRLLNYIPDCPMAAGGVLGFTRRMFDAIGGYNADMLIEDDEFCIRAHLGGYRLHFVPKAVMHYRLRSDLGSIYRQSRTYAKSDVRVAKLHRDRRTGPRPEWFALAQALRRAVTSYLRWRLAAGPRDMARGARIHWQLGRLSGQIVGAITYRAAPTFGMQNRPPQTEVAASTGVPQLGV